jgi:1-deoxyxylulose-5-phosphate synthase
MNLVYREEEREMLPFCIDQGIGVIPWSPLARGFLAGNRQRDGEMPTRRAGCDQYAQDLYFQPHDFDVVDRVVEVAQARGVSPSQVALAWLLNKPGITSPIIGASKMNHLEEAVAATEIILSEEEIRLLEDSYQPHLVLGHS